MKNTAYAFAKDHLDGPIEDYGRALAEHFLADPQVDGATVNIRAHHWARDRRRRHARPRCVRARRRGDAGRDRRGDPRRHDRRGRRRGPRRHEDDALGVQRLPARPVHDAARDRRPADGHEDHRHLALRRARPRRRRDVRGGPPRRLLEVFADHDSPSVQTSIWIMARAILERHEEVDEVRMVLPNLHHWLVDLSPFGLENDREIYIADDRAARPDRGDRASRGGLTMPDVAGLPPGVELRRGRRPGRRPDPDRRRARVRGRPPAPLRSGPAGPAPPPRGAPGRARRRASGPTS